MQDVLDNPSFDFFWSFVDTWLAFRRNPNANAEEYLSGQRAAASQYGFSSTPVLKKADDVTRRSIEPGTESGSGSKPQGQF